MATYWIYLLFYHSTNTPTTLISLGCFLCLGNPHGIFFYWQTPTFYLEIPLNFYFLVKPPEFPQATGGYFFSFSPSIPFPHCQNF